MSGDAERQRAIGGTAGEQRSVLLVLILTLVSVRAWRGLRFNKEYAAKLQKKLARAKAQERAVAAAEGRASEQRSVAKVNPFAVGPIANCNVSTLTILGTVEQSCGP
jgi:hypothetical protein